MYCMKCGAPNDDSARFCIKCGTTLVQVKATPPQPPPQVVRPAPHQPPPARLERRRRVPRWLVTVGVVFLTLLLLVGAALVGAYFWLGFHRSNQTAKIVPADTPLMISLSPDPRQALRYREIESLEAVLPLFGIMPELRETAEEAQDDLLAEFDIDLRKDVLPWIGAEISVAMIDTEGSGYSGLPPIILAVATRSEKRSDLFLEKVRQIMEQEGATFEEEVYQGTRVTYEVSEYGEAFAPAFATFNHLVVMGTDREALHRSIEMANTAGAQVLADRETYAAILAELPANRLGYVYLDGETLLREYADETDLPLQLASVEGAAASLGLAADGVRLDYAVSYTPELLDDARQGAGEGGTGECKTAELVPSEAVAYWSGRDPYPIWFAVDALIGMSEAYDYFDDTGMTIEERAECMTEATGVDVEDDLLAQLAGEWALAVLPDPTGLLGEEAMPLGVVLFAEIEDPQELEYTLDGLIQVMEDEGAIVHRTEIEGEPCTILEGDWDDWGFGYGFMDDVLVVGTSESMLRAAIRGQDDPLADGQMFQAVLEELPDEAGSYFFADLYEAYRLAYDAADRWDRENLEEMQPYLESIGAIGASAGSMDEAGTSSGTLFLYTGTQR